MKGRWEVTTTQEFYGAITKLPKSKYAIPVSEIVTDYLGDKVTGDFLFVEIREWKKHTYLRRLYGNVGGFTRVKVDLQDSVNFVRILSGDPAKYAKLFGLHFRCCACCGAELTDQRSRELALGPICRIRFGLK